MARLTVPAADALIDNEFKVLNKGFVRLIDYMGGDDRIVQSARVSYGNGTKTKREDAALIDYLLRNEHTSPFEQVVLTFHIKAPIFVARQWVRHRTARMNEISGRYSKMADDFYFPEISDIRAQSKTNKQGRSDSELDLEIQKEFLSTLQLDQVLVYKRYEKYVDQDIARELARVNLPLSLYTEFYWQIDLHNLFHFLRLRLDAHAQKEIRVYGEVLAKCAQAVAPVAFSAFEKHIRLAIKFSADELDLLRTALADNDDTALQEIRSKLLKPDLS